MRAMKRSPLGLDLYLWLTYRTFGLKRPLRLTRCFTGSRRSRPGRTINSLSETSARTVCAKRKSNAWPDLHLPTVKGALLRAAAHRRNFVE